MKKELGERLDLTTEISVVGISKDINIKSKGAPKDDLNYGEIDVVISNSGEDRHGERIIMEGIDISQAKRNPTVLWAHEYSELSVGKLLNIWKEGSNLMGRIRFAYDIYEFAHTVYKMVVGGFINAVSIGGIVREFGKSKENVTDYSIIKKLEMVELSVVPVGAHPDALVVAKSVKKDLGISKKELMSQYEDMLKKSEVLDKISKLTENDKNKYLSVLKELVGMLENVDSGEPIEAKDETETTKKVLVLKLDK